MSALGQMNIKLSKEMQTQIEARSKLEGMTKTAYILKAVKEYMDKDLNFQNEQLGTLEQMNADLKKVKEDFGLYYSLFTYFLVYFFAVNDGVIEGWRDPNDPKNAAKTTAIRNELFAKAKKRRDIFIETYKKECKNTENLLEIMLGDYMLENADK